MTPLDILRVATGALAANKLRSALTVLGIVIGITAVIALMSVGRGAQAAVTERIQGIGTNLLFVQPGQATEGGVRGTATLASLTLEDATALAGPGETNSISLVAPQVTGFGQIVAGGLNTRAQLLGITPEFQWVRNFNIADGEFIAPEQVLARSSVAVLGAEVANTLFPDSSPLGKSVRINRQSFRVIGVLESKGGTAFGSQDNAVLVPLTTFVTRLQAQRATRGGGISVDTINVQATSSEQVDAAKEEVAAILRERHGVLEDDFTITSQQDIIQALSQVT
ncbi:MAG: ABC transporter permease, partial [Chloroflexi bacterium]|nr:ABC transporter permease [Chloroflexota bacterium]